MKLKPNLHKLRKLAAHLRTVPPENFDFGTVWCGTVGCAMGHAVSVFPELRLSAMPLEDEDKYQEVSMADDSEHGYDDCARKLFSLSRRDAINLFTPGQADLTHEDLPELTTSATPTEVADLLEQFCQLVESGKLEQYEI